MRVVPRTQGVEINAPGGLAGWPGAVERILGGTVIEGEGAIGSRPRPVCHEVAEELMRPGPREGMEACGAAYGGSIPIAPSHDSTSAGQRVIGEAV